MKLPKDPKDYYIKTPPNERGRGPSLRQISREYKLSFTNIARRSTQENWVDKRQQFQNKVATKTEEKTIDKISEMNAKHITYAQYIQSIAINALRGDDKTKPLKIKNVGDAHRLLSDGVKIERQARDQPTEKLEIIEKIASLYD